MNMSANFFCIFTVDAVWRQKNYSYPIFSLLCRWHCWHLKNMNVSEEISKSTVRWHFVEAIDAVEIKKLICQLIFFRIFTVDIKKIIHLPIIFPILPLTSKNCSINQFFFVFLPLTLLTSKKLYTSLFFFSTFLLIQF